MSEGVSRETLQDGPGLPTFGDREQPGTAGWLPVRVVSGGTANRARCRCVGVGMEEIDPLHVSEPGLVVLDITAADADTALAAMTELGRLWATSGVVPTWRVPGEPGVRARLYVNTRQPGTRETGRPTTRP